MGLIETIVLSAIPKGKNNAIKRSELASKVHLGDRELRNVLSELRANGHPIINNSDGRGYYLSNNADEIERYARQEFERAMRVLSISRKMKMAAVNYRKEDAFVK